MGKAPLTSAAPLGSGAPTLVRLTVTVPRVLVAAITLAVCLTALGWAAGYQPGRPAALPAGPRPAAAAVDDHVAPRPDRVSAPSPGATVAASAGVWHFLAGPVDADTEAFETAWRHAFDTRTPSADLAVAIAADRLAATLDAHADALDRLQWRTAEPASAATRAAEASRAHAEALGSFGLVIRDRGIERAVLAYLEVGAADSLRRQHWLAVTLLLEA
jgi:hypothetical protein